MDQKSSVEPNASAGKASFFGRHEFAIRRLHSLSGLMPVGAYMCLHLFTNASVLANTADRDVFQNNVDLIHSLPALPIIEWVGIFLPIIFHAVVGVAIAIHCQPNTGSYRYGSNIRYTMQRVTAWIAMFFIFYHVAQMHGWVPLESVKEQLRAGGAFAQFDPENATQTVTETLASVTQKVIYLVGVLSCVYHLANGLWTMGITWGVWTTPAAQRRANFACIGFGVALAFVGLGALFGFSTERPSKPHRAATPADATPADATPTDESASESRQ